MVDTIYNYFVEQIQNNQFFSGAFFTTALAGIAVYFREIPKRIWGRIVRFLTYSVTIEQEAWLLHKYCTIYFSTKYGKKIKSAEAKLIEDTIIYEHEDDYFRMWYKKRWLTISHRKQKNDATSNFGDNQFARTYSISGLLAKKQIHELMEDIKKEGVAIIEQMAAKRKKVLLLGSSTSANVHVVGDMIGKPFSQLVIRNKEKLIKDLETFRDSKEKYTEIGKPYKRGYAFYGPPGNGKSSAAYAIANHLKWDVFPFKMTVSDPIELHNRIPANTVVTFDDFDTYYTGRKAKKDVKINFATLLNMLSGPNQRNDLIYVFTTNHLEKLDPALLRSGRCDYIEEFANPNKKEVEELLERLYGEKIVIKKLGVGHSYSDVQEYATKEVKECMQLLSYDKKTELEAEIFETEE